MLCLSGFELYSRWVPLIRAFTFLIYLTRLTSFTAALFGTNHMCGVKGAMLLA